MMVLESMLVLHDKSPALFVSHLEENCAKDGLVNIWWLGRNLPGGLDNVPVDIKTRSSDLGKYLPCYVEVSIPSGR